MENKDICSRCWEEYEPGLRKIANIKLESVPDEIDDVIQDVFLAFCKRVKQSGAPDDPKSFIYQIFYNTVNQKYRDVYKKRERETSITGKVYNIPFEEDFTDRIIEESSASEDREKIEAKLSPDELLLLKFIYEDRLKQKEIAAKLNTTEAAVKQKHYRIIRKIRKSYKNK